MALILVTGGCGYIGCRLVPALLADGHSVRVLDCQYFGDHVPRPTQFSERLRVDRTDIRQTAEVGRALEGVDAVVHLAAMSNDPSAELDPEFTRAINLDATMSLIQAAKGQGVPRFINASTATVYGVREEADVDEAFEHNPVSLYGKYKSETDKYLSAESSPAFVGVNLRAATVCGWSPRPRLDLTVNILAAQARAQGVVRVHGGQQKRPNVVIDDLVRAYQLLLCAPASAVSGESFNVAASSLSILEIAHRVISAVGRKDCELVIEPIIDRRSYHVSARKIADRLGFSCRLDIEEGARQIADAIEDGRLADPSSQEHVNIKHLTKIGAVQRRV